MSDRSTASQAAKSVPWQNGSFARHWGNPSAVVAAALQHFDNPKKDEPLGNLLPLFHSDPITALPDIATEIRTHQPMLSVFTQWLVERRQAGCNDARRLFAAGTPRRTGRSKAARARRRRARAAEAQQAQRISIKEDTMKLTVALILVNDGLEQPFEYHQLLRAARMGTVPVSLNPEGTRWTVELADIPAIRAVMLGTRQARVTAAQSEGSA